MPLTKVCSHCLATGHIRRSVCTNCGHPFLVKQSKVSKKLVARQALATESLDKSLSRKAKNRKSMCIARAIETEEQAVVRKCYNTRSMSRARANESKPQTVVRRALH